MPFTFKLSRRLALIFAAMTGGAVVGCSIDEPASVPLDSPPQFAVGDTLFSDGFESGVLAWDDNFRPSAKQILAAAARTGARGLRITFKPKGTGGVLSKFVTPGDRVHFRAAVRFPATWTGATGLLMLRAATAANPWAGFGTAGVCPSGTAHANTGVTTTTPNLDLRFNTYYVGMPSAAPGSCPGSTGLSGPSTATYPAAIGVSKGAWHIVEIEAQLNTVGAADGWQRVWLDDVLAGEWTGLSFRTSSAVQWNAVSLELTPSGVTQTQALDIDDIVVQRQRLAAALPPAPPPPPPAPTTLFTESFDNTSFASRAWYDFSGTPAVSTSEKRSGTGSLLVEFATGAQSPPMKRMRQLFTPTDRLYVSYWVKYSPNYVGSGRSYHPHEFGILSNQDQDWDGLTFNYLNTYIEQSYQNGGVPRISIQDSRMIDVARIGQNLTNVTEQRSISGCNGNSDGTGSTSCYQVSATEWYNAKTWDAAAVAFMPSPGVDYKGNWNHVEVEFQLNSVLGGIGQKDGVLRYWLNGNLKLERTNIMFRTGANPNLKFRQFIISPYIGDGSPVTQQMWIDDLTLGTSRPGSTTTPVPPPPSPPPVATVTLTPATASLLVGATTTFNAVLRDSAGNVLGGRQVTWSASPSTVATVVNGVVTARSAGQATIAAISEGRTGVALITVTAPQPEPVASVSVTPSNATLQAGGTTPLNVELRSAAGAVLTGRVVTWSTSAPAAATVVNGVVTGVAAGQATVSAISEGRSGSAAITVTGTTTPPPAPTPGTYPNEPSGAVVMMDYDTDFGAPSNPPWGYISGTSNLSTVTDPSAPVNPEKVGRVRFGSGCCNGTGPARLESYPRLPTNWTRMYVSDWIKFDSNWQPHACCQKLFEFFWSSGGDKWLIVKADPTNGGFPLVPRFTTEYAGSPTSNVGGRGAIQPNIWYQFEVVLHKSGRLQMWIRPKGGSPELMYDGTPPGAGSVNPSILFWWWGYGGLGAYTGSTAYINHNHIRVSYTQ